MSRRVPRASFRHSQNLEVKRLSRSEMIETGTPCLDTTSLMYKRVSFSNLSVSRIGRKCADFVNRSTITQIMSWPLVVLGNLVMKSIVILSHLHSGISGCWSKPDGLWVSALTFAQVKHCATYAAISLLKFGHQ